MRVQLKQWVHDKIVKDYKEHQEWDISGPECECYFSTEDIYYSHYFTTPKYFDVEEWDDDVYKIEKPEMLDTFVLDKRHVEPYMVPIVITLPNDIFEF